MDANYFHISNVHIFAKLKVKLIIYELQSVSYMGFDASAIAFYGVRLADLPCDFVFNVYRKQGFAVHDRRFDDCTPKNTVQFISGID